MDLNIGKKLDGRYEITELIGIGGMADVYKAVDIMENRVVAVKILKPEFSENEEFLKRFRNESKAIAVLSHPNIVKIYDVGFNDDIQFIVMEYIDGITLKEFIEQQGALRWKDALHFITQILRALQHAHDRGIIHRDIKPQNIMLFADGTIKVMDFGIARFSRVDGKTMSEKTIGSVHYISPEQASGDYTDERSDIYSVGVMLYEMLTGRKMFDGENPVSVALMHMQDQPTYPRTYVPSIPEALEEIVMHAVEKEPAKRYQSAAEMIKDIDTFKMDQSVVFGYIPREDEEEEDSEGGTKYFTPVTPAASRKYEEEDDDEYDDEYDDEEEEEPRKSYVFPILCASAVAVVIIACVVIFGVISKFNKSSDDGSFEMPNLINTVYTQAAEQYKDMINFNVVEEYNSEYGEGLIFDQSVAEGKTSNKGINVSVKVSKGPRMIQVPEDLVGHKYSDSIENELKQLGFEVKKMSDWSDEYDVDVIFKVDPESGTSAEAGSTIVVYVSYGPLSNSSEMPKVIGLTKEEAQEALAAKRFTNIKFKDVDVKDPAKGTVVSQSVTEGTSIPRDKEIIIGVSTGVEGAGSVDLSVPIPAGASGSFTFNVYNDSGSIIQHSTVEKAEYYAGTNITIKNVTGTGVQTLMVEAVNDKTSKAVKYAVFTADFSAKTATQTSVDKDAFIKIVETTTKASYTVNFTQTAGVKFAGAETVTEGSDYTFSVSVDSGFNSSAMVVRVNGSAVSKNADGTYTVKEVTGNLNITVEGVAEVTTPPVTEPPVTEPPATEPTDVTTTEPTKSETTPVTTAEPPYYDLSEPGTYVAIEDGFFYDLSDPSKRLKEFHAGDEFTFSVGDDNTYGYREVEFARNIFADRSKFEKVD